MSFNVYFDESNKITKDKNEIFSYYGAVGCDCSTASFIDDISIDENIELHFVKFKLKDMDAYIKIINEVLKKEVYFNAYVVDSQEAYRHIKYLGIDEKLLRPLLYIKIPERLIYGITRHIQHQNDVNIYIDKNDEYEKYELAKKLEEQLNAQSIYRKLNYSISDVKSLDSKETRLLQISDVLLGVVSFLFEEKYLKPQEFLPKETFIKIKKILNGEELNFFTKCYGAEKNGRHRCLICYKDLVNYSRLKSIFNKTDTLFYSGETLAKCEMIYNIFLNKLNLSKLSNLNIFIWSKEDDNKNLLLCYPQTDYYKEIKKVQLSNYITQFFHFKNDLDTNYKNKILHIYKNSTGMLSINDYIEKLGVPKNLKLLIRRYLNDLDIKTVESEKMISSKIS